VRQSRAASYTRSVLWWSRDNDSKEGGPFYLPRLLTTVLTTVMMCLVIAFLASQTMAEAAKGGRGQWDSISYYSPNGNRTCSGEPYRGNEMTAAASPIYDLGTELRVRWQGRSVRVVVNDCTGLPHGANAAFDLSYRAAKKLRILEAGRIYPPDAKAKVVGRDRDLYYRNK
jgi:rare lipoprotein A (peptidoglycan hydrolase)